MGTFFNSETWRGGFYEVAMDFGTWSEPKLNQALQAVWNTPSLRGCYLRPDLDPSEQERVSPSVAALESHGHLRGLAILPCGKQVACGTYLIREDEGTSWVGLYISLGALAEFYDVQAYPFVDLPSSRQWREPLENWLADIGEKTFSKVPFKMGLVGFEVLDAIGSPNALGFAVPEERSIGYLVPTNNHLGYYPTNQWQPTPQRAS